MTTQIDQQTKQSRRILGLVTVFFWASEYCHVPFFTPYLKTLGLTATVIGFLVGSYGFTQMCIRIPLGIFADVKSQYRLIVISGCFFSTVSALGLFLFENIVLLFFFRILAGVAASTWVAFTVMYSGYYAPEESSAAMSHINAYNNTGKFLAFVVGTVTASVFSYRMPLMMSFLTGVIALVLSFFVKDVKVTRKPVQLKALLGTFREVGVILPSGLAIVQQMILQATAFSFTSEVARGLGASATEIGVSSSLFTIFQISAALFVGHRLANKLGERRVIPMAFLLMTAYCVAVGLAPNMYVIYFAQMFGGFANATLLSMLLAGCIKYVAPEKKSTAMGFFQAVYGIGMTIGPVLMGRLVDLFGSASAFNVFGVFSAAAGFAAYLLIPMVAKKYAK